MNAEIEKQIQEYVPKLQDKINVLHFSTGSDSVACFLRLKEWGINPILVYNYYLPHIPMVDNYIDYFEKKFNVHIYRLPSTLYLNNTDNALYQLPIKGREKFRNDITEFKLLRYKTDKANKDFQRKQILEYLNCKKGEVIFHKGLRYTDGFFRFYNIETSGVMTKDYSFLPIASFEISDVQNILRKYECKLPIEYNLWGISFESPRAWNVNLIKENCPESWKYICEYFPMTAAICYRDKYIELNAHFKARIKQFNEFSIEKNLYEKW